jgi:hypothetical protein
MSNNLLVINGNIIGGLPIASENLRLLWENPTPTDSFAAQSITLSSGDYDFLLIVYRETISSTTYKSDIVSKGSNGILEFNVTSGSFYNDTRTFTYTSDTVLAFAAATVNGSSNNSAVVPLAIYGIYKKSIANTEASKCIMSDGVTSVETAINEQKAIYSTTEHVIGRWIDGSVLYEKTVDFGALPNNTTKSVAHCISNMSEVTECVTRCTRNDGNVFRPFDSFTTVKYYITKSEVVVITTDNLSVYDKSHITLRYTKTS